MFKIIIFNVWCLIQQPKNPKYILLKMSILHLQIWSKPRIEAHSCAHNYKPNNFTSSNLLQSWKHLGSISYKKLLWPLHEGDNNINHPITSYGYTSFPSKQDFNTNSHASKEDVLFNILPKYPHPLVKKTRLLFHSLHEIC